MDHGWIIIISSSSVLKTLLLIELEKLQFYSLKVKLDWNQSETVQLIDGSVDPIRLAF